MVMACVGITITFQYYLGQVTSVFQGEWNIQRSPFRYAQIEPLRINTGKITTDFIGNNGESVGQKSLKIEWLGC